MNKSTALYLSLFCCAAAPLMSACVESAPPDDVPERAPLAKDPGEGSPSASANIFPAEATPYGKSYEEWAAAWWQWLLPIPKDESPQEGADCDVNQSGQVFFLAGNFGGTSTRSCAIPAGKAILFPVLNATQANCPELAGGGYTCEASMDEATLRAGVSWAIDLDHTLTLEIDGDSVEGLADYRIQSDMFNTGAPAEAEDRLWSICSGPIRENSCGVPVGTPRGVVTDGYWVMLRPLPPGEHHVHLAAEVLLSGQTLFALDITYAITVAP